MRSPASLLLAASATLTVLLLLSACRSDHVDITIRNQTDAAVRLLEVDYPSASFGADSLAPGAALRYRVQIRGNGPITLTFSAPTSTQPRITGPSLADRQQGSIEVLLLPGGKTEFHPHFVPLR